MVAPIARAATSDDFCQTVVHETHTPPLSEKVWNRCTKFRFVCGGVNSNDEGTEWNTSACKTHNAWLLWCPETVDFAVTLKTLDTCCSAGNSVESWAEVSTARIRIFWWPRVVRCYGATVWIGGADRVSICGKINQFPQLSIARYSQYMLDYVSIVESCWVWASQVFSSQSHWEFLVLGSWSMLVWMWSPHRIWAEVALATIEYWKSWEDTAPLLVIGIQWFWEVSGWSWTDSLIFTHIPWPWPFGQE